MNLIHTDAKRTEISKFEIGTEIGPLENELSQTSTSPKGEGYV